MESVCGEGVLNTEKILEAFDSVFESLKDIRATGELFLRIAEKKILAAVFRLSR